MSITRLQQARQMYALGKLVERVRFQGGGRDAGAGSGFGDGPSSSDGDNDRPTMADISGPKTTSSPKGGEVDRPNPHTVSGTSKTSTVNGKQMQSAARDFVQTLNTNNAIRAAQTKTKFSPFDNFTPTFAPTTVNKKTPLDYAKQLLSIAAYVSPHTLAGKIGLGLTTYDRAKTGLQAVSSIADTFGINTDSITNSLSNNFSGKKSNTTTNTNTNNGGDREGLASLENQASGYDEYVLLLQKLQSGNITDEERTRYTMLKNMLGI